MEISQKVILDTEILETFPQILDLNSNFYKFCTTTLVVMDIQQGYNFYIKSSTKRKLLASIEKHKKNGGFEIYNPPHSILTKYPTKLSSSEQSIIDLADQLSKDQHVVIATMSEQIKGVASSLGMQIYELDFLIDLYTRWNQKNKEDLKLEMYYGKKNLLSVGKKVFYGLFAFAGCSIVFYYRGYFISNLNATALIILTVVLSILLFMFRERQRVSYGILEFAVGLSSVIILFYPTFNFGSNLFNVNNGVRYLGGIYIMIRGMDNVVKGVSNTTLGQILKYRYKIGR